MKSLISEMAKRFHEIVEESCEQCDRPKSNCNCDEELDEQNVTGAVAGYNIPGAFTTKKKFKQKKFDWAGGMKESVNVKPSYELGKYQQPESDEEVFNDKFPFAPSDDYWWQSDNIDYPTKFYADGMGTNSIKDKTTRIGNLPDTSTPARKPKNDYIQVHEAMDSKYEQLIESYRKFTTDDATTSPEQKVKKTIREVSKRLQEIEEMVNYSSRLKIESGLSRDGYGKSVNSALTKISERLTKIAERVRALGE